jgi:hypothetical protein
MYEASLDDTELWQGDVISNIHLPNYSFKNSGFLYELLVDGTRKYGGKAVSQASESKAIILSQCCEFNEAKRHWFSLAKLVTLSDLADRLTLAFNIAPLQPISKAGIRYPPPDELLKSNVIEVGDQSNNKLLSSYVYDRDGHHLAEPHVADFTRVTSISMNDKAYVLSKKILQLDDAHRLEFKKKLAYFFIRPAV